MAKRKKYLVIVESPTKAKTIAKMISDDYMVFPSMGHLYDLPRSKMGIDVEGDFKPKYFVIPERKKVLEDLKKKSKTKKEIYIATDPDREGEAIGYNLVKAIGRAADAKRVTFHEITKKAILEAFQNAKKIDVAKVNAQQARRVLDRIVGYSISPLLWKKVGRGLSAGRVQSVVVRLIVDREKEVKAFRPQEYWSIDAELSPEKSADKIFQAHLEKIDNKKPKIVSKAKAQWYVDDMKDKPFNVKEIRFTEKVRKPYPPYITSSLQQDSYNKLSYQAQRTMRIAQNLYEGVALGDEGMTGLITYMRTDSVNIAKDAQALAREFIKSTYGEKYIPKKPNVYHSRKSAQEAHEAIRPTDPSRTPESIKQYLNPDEYKLYNLIWKRFLASQMNPAKFNAVSIDIMAGTHYLFRANGQEVTFDGFLVLEETREDDEKYSIPDMSEGEILKLIKLVPEQHFTKSPPRYTDASLIKALEEDGIGRPSTYAPILSTVIGRNYVGREKGSLIPTELGIAVTELLVKSFPTILDVGFTAQMEEEFDKIEENTLDSVKVLKEFYGPFQESLVKAETAMRSLKEEVEEVDEKCPDCGRGMVIKWSRRGKFMSCSGFPKCRYAQPLTTGIPCPEPNCDGELIKRYSRKTRRSFYGCSKYPNCNHISNALPKQDND